MKKFYLLNLIFVLTLSSFGLTFTSCDDDAIKNPATVTVSHAKTLKDDAQVRLVGNIENGLGPEMYLFSDDTGSIAVEIDNDVWAVNLKDPTSLSFPIFYVEIVGEANKEYEGMTIDVKRMTIR